MAVGAVLRFGRALARRCPNCGRGRIFKGWLAIRDFCPSCGLWLERGQGFYTGAIAINLVTSELLFLVGFIVSIVVTWPDTPWGALQLFWMAFMVIAPLVFWPFSKTLWLAVDLTIRPVEGHEVVPGFTATGAP